MLIDIDFTIKECVVVSLKDLSQEKINDMAMIDIAAILLEEENKALDFREIFNRIAKLKGFSENQKEEALNQFYTDLNIDGRFMTKGSNIWGLKRWYPVEEIDEDITTEPKKKKKKKKATKKAVIDDLDIDEDIDEEEDELTLDEDIIELDEEEDDDVEAEDIEEDDFDFDDDDDDLEDEEDFDDDFEEEDEDLDDDEEEEEK
jgi:DNA-directed RNA polymerase subunit delta